VTPTCADHTTLAEDFKRSNLPACCLIPPSSTGTGRGNSAPGSYDPAGSPGSELYFTAGPNKGTGGLFGYLKPVATDLTEGNDQ
jgi:hypothetical protein